MKFGSEKPNLMVRATEAHSPQPRLSVRPAPQQGAATPGHLVVHGQECAGHVQVSAGLQDFLATRTRPGKGRPFNIYAPPKGQASDPPGTCWRAHVTRFLHKGRSLTS